METFSALGSSCFFSSSSSFAQHAQSWSGRSFVPRSLVLSLDQIYIPLLSGSKTPWAAANCQPCYTHLATLCLSTALGHSLVRTVGARWVARWMGNMGTPKALSCYVKTDILSQESWRRNGILRRPSGRQVALFITVTKSLTRWHLCRDRFISACSLRREITCIFASSMESWAYHHCPFKRRGEKHRHSFFLSKANADVRSCQPAPPHHCCLQGWPAYGWLLMPPTALCVHQRCTPFSLEKFCLSPQWDHWECVGQPFSNVGFLPVSGDYYLKESGDSSLTLSNCYLQLIKINVWHVGAGRRGITFTHYNLQPGLQSLLRNLHE